MPPKALRGPTRRASGALHQAQQVGFLLDAAGLLADTCPQVAAALGRRALQVADGDSGAVLPRGAASSLCGCCGAPFTADVYQSGRVVRLPRHYVRRKLQAATSGAAQAGAKQQVNRAAVVYTCKVCGHGTARPFYTAEAARHAVQKAGGLPSPPPTQSPQAQPLQPKQQPQPVPAQPPNALTAAAAAQLLAPAATPAADAAVGASRGRREEAPGAVAEAAPARPASGPGTLSGLQPAATLATECGPAMPPQTALQAERGGQLGGEAEQRMAAEPSAEGDVPPAQPTGSPETGMQCPGQQWLQQGAVPGGSEPPVCSEAAVAVDTPAPAAPPAGAPGCTLLAPEGGGAISAAQPGSASAARHQAAGSGAAAEVSAAAAAVHAAAGGTDRAAASAGGAAAGVLASPAAAEEAAAGGLEGTAAGEGLPPGGAVLGAPGSQEAGAEECLSQPLSPQQQGGEGRQQGQQEGPAQAEEEDEQGEGAGGSPEDTQPRKRRRISWRQELEDVQLIPPAAAAQQGIAPGQPVAELGGRRRRRAWFRVGRAWKSANL